MAEEILTSFSFETSDLTPMFVPRRPCKNGTYDAHIVKGQFKRTGAGKEAVVLKVLVHAPLDAAPDGEPEMDFWAVKGAAGGRLTNFAKIFCPAALDKGANLADPHTLEGSPLQVTIRQSKPKLFPDGKVQYESAAEIDVLLAPKPTARLITTRPDGSPF